MIENLTIQTYQDWLFQMIVCRKLTILVHNPLNSLFQKELYIVGTTEEKTYCSDTHRPKIHWFLPLRTERKLIFASSIVKHLLYCLTLHCQQHLDLDHSTYQSFFIINNTWIKLINHIKVFLHYWLCLGQVYLSYQGFFIINNTQIKFIHNIMDFRHLWQHLDWDFLQNQSFLSSITPRLCSYPESEFLTNEVNGILIL